MHEVSCALYILILGLWNTKPLFKQLVFSVQGKYHVHSHIPSCFYRQKNNINQPMYRIKDKFHMYGKEMYSQ